MPGHDELPFARDQAFGLAVLPVPMDLLSTDRLLPAAYLNDPKSRIPSRTVAMQLYPDRSLRVDDHRYDLNSREAELLNIIGLLPRGYYAAKQVFYDAGFGEEYATANSRDVVFSRSMSRLRRAFADFNGVPYLRKKTRESLGHYALSAAIIFSDSEQLTVADDNVAVARQAFFNRVVRKA